MSFSNCDLWSLQKWHSWKQQTLSYINPKEKRHLIGSTENTFALFFIWTLISPNNSKNFWVFWGLAKDSLSLFIWKHLLTMSKHLLKVYTRKSDFITVFLLNNDLSLISNRFLRKQKHRRFLRPNKRNP